MPRLPLCSRPQTETSPPPIAMSDQEDSDMERVSHLLSSLETADNRQDAVAAAVRQLSEQAATSGEGIGDFLWDVFNAVFDVAGDTAPENQDALIDFILKLRQEDVSDRNGQPVTYEGARVWTGLPSFGWVVRDGWNFGKLSTLYSEFIRSSMPTRASQMHPMIPSRPRLSANCRIRVRSSLASQLCLTQSSIFQLSVFGRCDPPSRILFGMVLTWRPLSDSLLLGSSSPATTSAH